MAVITRDIVAAYTQCPLKAFFLLHADKNDQRSEYEQLILDERQKARQQYFGTLNGAIENFNGLKCLGIESQYITDAVLNCKDLQGNFDLLQKRSDTKSNFGNYSYEPLIFSGTKIISDEQKKELFLLAYILYQIQGVLPVLGTIIAPDGYMHRLQLANATKELRSTLRELRAISGLSENIPPPFVSRLHPHSCKFGPCIELARELNSLSLLGRITPKTIKQYAKKGIFSVDQLSYLYRQRRQRKRGKDVKPLHKYELQALAIRTRKIYIQELPQIDRKQVEYYLDIEGVPDKENYYLIGLVRYDGTECVVESFWSDDDLGEEEMWRGFLSSIQKYSSAPVYHYGSYDLKAVRRMCGRYHTDFSVIEDRFINVNALIFGHIYFPVYENSLKEIARYLDTFWSSSDASGLQSLVWRYYWEKTAAIKYKELLTTYNQEDCQALKAVVDKLIVIKEQASSMPDVDFADSPKNVATKSESQIRNDFNSLLRWAHADYDKRKISFREIGQRSLTENKLKIRESIHKRLVPYARKVVRVPRRRMCPRHTGTKLTKTKTEIEKTVIDIVLMHSGVKKVIVKYIGYRSYCSKCGRNYDPLQIKLIKNRLFGHGFQAWVVYQRLALRMSYTMIQQSLEDEFNEIIGGGTIAKILSYFADYYAVTEKTMHKELLKSPFIHIDETRISIRGERQYVWVFTDGIHSVFKLTATREAGVVSDVLGSYDGIIVSDFFTGYDDSTYRHQKCWVHLIRDLNDDLWETPYDTEFESFVINVKELILPIFDAVARHGLKRQYLKKFESVINKFYVQNIEDCYYESELTNKYQKRFKRYRESLFMFITEDGISWNNNMAERALRHFAVQRNISGSFYESTTHQYLLLLGITQACRFQGKSLLHFLVSGEKNVDAFKKRTHLRRTQAVRVAH